jgi:hypothetical protein
VLVLNVLIVRLVGRYIVSAVTYPFSNVFASRYLKRNLNAKFGNEFCKRIDHMSSMLGLYASLGEKMSPENLPINSLSNSQAMVESECSESGMFRMQSAIDLYHLMAGNIELIELYLQVNTQIISETGRNRYSRLFMHTTDVLEEIKECMQGLKCSVTFRHPWLPVSG